MPTKQRELLLKINAQLVKMATPPPPTFSPQTGTIKPPTLYQPGVTPTPTLPITYK